MLKAEVVRKFSFGFYRKENMRSCGVLLSISSLPSKYGIGCFSKEAYDFIDKLKEAGQSYWQILPLGPTSYGDSPYQSFSTYAGNPYFIDLEELIRLKLVTESEVNKYNFGKNPRRVDYAEIYNSRFKVLKKAYEKAKSSLKSGKLFPKEISFEEFKKENVAWLSDYALFMALKDSFGGKAWNEWEEGLKLRDASTLKKYREKLSTEIEFYEFIQYVFIIQWKKLKKYANDNDIKIIGDVPIYVAFDSADAWANPELFEFDENLNPIEVAGCPPDGFAKYGQLWGNPIYRWSYHKETDYEWWISRLRKAFTLYDTVRIDHFRGFDSYYAVPFGEKTAVKGKWRKGPGYSLFAQVKKSLGDVDVIAEDLGYLTPSVIKLVKRTGYPGMKILQFAFYDMKDGDYQVHNYTSNSVVYTGTHDNETTMGWLCSISKKVRNFALEYMNIKTNDEKEIVWEMIQHAYMSVSDKVIIPMQDFLCLGNEARMNTPSTLGGNWEWRMGKKAFSTAIAKKMHRLAVLYARIKED